MILKMAFVLNYQFNIDIIICNIFNYQFNMDKIIQKKRHFLSSVRVWGFIFYKKLKIKL